MAELDSDVDPVPVSPARFLTGSLAGAYLTGSADQEEEGTDGATAGMKTCITVRVTSGDSCALERKRPEPKSPEPPSEPNTV